MFKYSAACNGLDSQLPLPWLKRKHVWDIMTEITFELFAYICDVMM